MANGESPNVHFVDDAFMPGSAWRPVNSPGERRINHHGFEHAWCAVPPVERKVGILVPDAITEVGVAPFEIADDLFGVGIEEKLIRIEAMAFGRIVGTKDTISVNESRPGLRQIAVPDLVGLLFQADAVQFSASGLIEQAQLHGFSVFREQGEVNALAVPIRSERIRTARPHDGLSLDDHSFLGRPYAARHGFEST